MESIVDRLKDALSALRLLSDKGEHGDMQDRLHAIGDFMYESLDEVIFTVEAAMEEITDCESYIAELEEQLKDSPREQTTN